MIALNSVSEPFNSAPRVLPRAEHPISRQDIAREALKVLYRLSGAGHRAYLVGGSVRDLMLGRVPKDFDVATDARPNEVRRLFRNARVIGRRFRLVHVIFPERIIEVSTFRREPEATERNGSASGDLLITSDNTFGTPEEDAHRRDFTINALFYDISSFSVLDYVGGVDDLGKRLIRAIGDPRVRFREDPVRMLRACELAGRLGFGIDPAAQEAIRQLAPELRRAAPARLLEELFSILRSGRAACIFQWALELGLLEHLLPEAYAMVAAGERGLGDLGQLLPALDRRATQAGQVADGTLLAAVLLPGILLRRLDIEAVAGRALTRRQWAALVEELSDALFQRFAVSRDRSRSALEALEGFLRLCEAPARVEERLRTAARPEFPAALWLFELLVEATGEGFEELAQWQAARERRPVLAKDASVATPAAGARAVRRRRRRKR